jgi:hypothetical protein
MEGEKEKGGGLTIHALMVTGGGVIVNSHRVSWGGGGLPYGDKGRCH